MEKILVIGACGQLGQELTSALRGAFGIQNVVAADINVPPPELEEGPFENLDILDLKRLFAVIKKYKISQLYNLAAMLSASGEKNPGLAWKLNMEGLINALEAAKTLKLDKVYWPSSIAVFGPHTPSKKTPQKAIMDPTTIYGISKLAGERWCAYYFHKYGLDIRSLRYPGLIGHKSMPGGGTTDYAVDIFHKAAEGKPFECFLTEDTYLPMMYMPDAINATLTLMQNESAKISVRDSYNIAAFSCSPREIVAAIKCHIPNFEVYYKPDERQAIADSWPDSIDDTVARKDWGWRHHFTLENMTEDILLNLNKKHDYG